MAKKITLKAWAEARYDPPPSAYILRRWVRDGEIYPPPEKVGHSYYVDQNAYRQTVETGRPSLVERLKLAER